MFHSNFQFKTFKYERHHARNSKYNIFPSEFYFCQGEESSVIAFKPSCDTDSQTNDIILGLVALCDLIPQLSSGWEIPGYMKPTKIEQLVD